MNLKQIDILCPLAASFSLLISISLTPGVLHQGKMYTTFEQGEGLDLAAAAATTMNDFIKAWRCSGQNGFFVTISFTQASPPGDGIHGGEKEVPKKAQYMGCDKHNHDPK